jgi:hypothetical protein
MLDCEGVEFTSQTQEKRRSQDDDDVSHDSNSEDEVMRPQVRNAAIAALDPTFDRITGALDREKYEKDVQRLIDGDPTLYDELGIGSSDSDSDSDIERRPKRPKLAKPKPPARAMPAKTKKATHEAEYLPPINKPRKSVLSDSMDLRKEAMAFKREKIAAKKELALSQLALERERASSESRIKESALAFEREKLEIERKRMDMEHDRFLVEHGKPLRPSVADEIV